MGDMERFHGDVFAGMDCKGDGAVVFDEFTARDRGFSYHATQAGRPGAYDTASRIVFAFWDRDGDGQMTEPGMCFAITADFRRADLNDDGMLSEAEFLNGFAVIVAMRAALGASRQGAAEW